MISRRTFLRGAVRTSAALAIGAVGATGYGVWEASHIRIDRQTITVPNLPARFDGTTVAVVADLHHGPYVGIRFIREAVRRTNSLKPDLITLVGDYGHRGTMARIELPPCLEALSELQAPLGVFAVPGNHDMQDHGQIYQELIADTPLTDLTNRSQRISKGGEHLWLAGVDDLWWGRPNLKTAIRDVPEGKPVLLLCHNSDFAEQSLDPRVGLMLSGHTHGGQVYLPVIGSPWIPSRCGLKYRRGLVQGPASQVFVSRGLGETGVPLRFNSPPEINLLTLIA
jgi:hypothetical protein